MTPTSAATAADSSMTEKRLDRIRRLHAERRLAKDASAHRRQLIGSALGDFLEEEDNNNNNNNNNDHGGGVFIGNDKLNDNGDDDDIDREEHSMSYDLPPLQPIEDNSSSSPSMNSGTSHTRRSTGSGDSKKKSSRKKKSGSSHSTKSKGSRSKTPTSIASRSSGGSRHQRVSDRLLTPSRDASHPEDTDGNLDRLLNKLNYHQQARIATDETQPSARLASASERRSRSVGMPLDIAQSRRRASGTRSVVSEVDPVKPGSNKTRSRSTGPLDAYALALARVNAATATKETSTRRARYTSASTRESRSIPGLETDGDSYIGSIVATPSGDETDSQTPKRKAKKSSKSKQSRSKSRDSGAQNTGAPSPRQSKHARKSFMVSPKASTHPRKVFVNASTRSSMRQSRSVDITANGPPVASPSRRTRKSSIRSTSVDPPMTVNGTPIVSHSARPTRTVAPLNGYVSSGNTEHTRRPMSKRIPSKSNLMKQHEQKNQSILKKEASLGDLAPHAPDRKSRRRNQTMTTGSAHDRPTSALDEPASRTRPKSTRKQKAKSVDSSRRSVRAGEYTADGSSYQTPGESSTPNGLNDRPERRRSDSRANPVNERQGRSVERSDPAGRHPDDTTKQRAQSCAPALTRHSAESIRKIDYNVLKENFLSAGHFANNAVLVNTERGKHGLPALKRNVQLDALACDYAQRTAKTPSAPQRITITHRGNLKRGPTIRVIHAAMMKNEAERANILNPHVTDFGMGTAKGADGLLYLCQLFSFAQDLTCSDL